VKNRRAKIGVIFLCLLTTATIISCSPTSTETTGQKQDLPKVADDSKQLQGTSQVEVTIENFAYHPDTLDIPVGTTVVWRNDDSVVHTVTANDESFNSGTMNGGAEFSHTFNGEGVFEYHCIPHPFMTGKITVSTR